MGKDDGVEELRLQPLRAMQAIGAIATKNHLDTRRIAPPVKELLSYS